MTRVLEHPLMHAAGEAQRLGNLRRETPIIATSGEDQQTFMTDGVVDLCYREVDEPDGPLWTVVDFKTDAEVSFSMEAYEQQVRTYAEGIARATGEPVRGVLLVL